MKRRKFIGNLVLTALVCLFAGAVGCENASRVPPSKYDPSNYRPTMTDEELIRFWKNAPGIDGVVDHKYYDSNGKLYRYQGNSFWKSTDGSWYTGDMSGHIQRLPNAPAWAALKDQNKPIR